MSTVHGLSCNGCGSTLTVTRERGEGHPDKATYEKFARSQGWNAPDKLGRHWCQNCRKRPARSGGAE